ncbi:hypothetical protein DPMN_124837 [Dreissena polymorpha]|uniref:Uncharacterized protein n=1 Tax=Dreissena polymorpha TaxID=45954 RepID=A0A9D4JWK1_DREPO|nr:hypothetical protein DPMN_124837 [Dreissena polymorpha]
MICCVLLRVTHPWEGSAIIIIIRKIQKYLSRMICCVLLRVTHSWEGSAIIIIIIIIIIIRKIQKYLSRMICCVLLRVTHPWEVSATLLHCPSSFFSECLDLDLPLACPGEKFVARYHLLQELSGFKTHVMHISL